MKKALLVGINDYPGSGNDLEGCVNDTANLRALLLKGHGFEAAGIRVLTDAKATRDAIMDGLEDLVSRASSGDTLVFHFSGHGSQVPDQDGDERSDRMDEVLCPRDFTWDGCWIRDDDLSDVFSRLPKDVHLEVLLDCCHSGTGTREIALGKRAASITAGIAGSITSRQRTAKIRFMQPPPRVVERFGAALRSSTPAAKIGSLVKAKPRGLNHVLWAACQVRPVFGRCGHRRDPQRSVHLVLLRLGKGFKRGILAGRASRADPQGPPGGRLRPVAAARVSEGRPG